MDQIYPETAEAAFFQIEGLSLRFRERGTIFP